jgi:hypothetical protein
VITSSGEFGSHYARYLGEGNGWSVAALSLGLAGPDDHTDNEIKEEVPVLQAA